MERLFHKSGFFVDVRDEAQAITKILLGKELGFSPIWSMTNIHVIKGKPELSANALASLVRLSGTYDYEVIETTDTACTLRFKRGDEELGVSTFQIGDATRAGLVKKDSNWTKYPRAMLFARAMSQGVRMYCPRRERGGPTLRGRRDFSSNGRMGPWAGRNGSAGIRSLLQGATSSDVGDVMCLNLPTATTSAEPE